MHFEINGVQTGVIYHKTKGKNMTRPYYIGQKTKTDEKKKPLEFRVTCSDVFQNKIKNLTHGQRY